jgi:hypothetical protein
VKELLPLAAAFTVLAALVVWHEATTETSRGLADEAGFKPLAVREFTPDDASRIEIAAPGGTAPALTLTKKDKSWRVMSSFEAPASGGAVTKLLDELAKAEGEFRSDDAAALEQFDLTPARCVGVRVLDKDGKPLVHLAVGRTSGQHGAFVRNLADGDDPKAYALASDLRGLLGLGRTSTGDREPEKPGAAHFHDKEFPQSSSKAGAAKRAELTAPGRVVAFDLVKKDEKDAAGAWVVASGGPGGGVKKDGLERAIAALGGGLHPTALVDPAKKKELGFDAPKYRIAVTGEDGTTRAAVGTSDAANEHWYVRLDVAQDPDVVYEASEYEFHQLFPQGQVLFDLPRVDVPREGPTRIVVTRKDRDTIDLSRKGTKPAFDWTLASPAWPLEPKQTALRGLAGTLGQVRVLDYVDGADLGDAEITVRWGAATAPEEQLAALAIGGKSPTGKERLATLPGRAGRVYVIGENVIDRVAPEPISLYEPKLLHGWTKDEVAAIRVVGGLALVRDGEGWSLDDGAGTKTKAAAAPVEKYLDRWLAVGVTGKLSGEAGFKAVPVSIERQDGTSVLAGVSVTKEGKRVLVLGAEIFTVDDKDDLVPDAAALAEPPPPPKPDTKIVTPEDEEKK